MFNHWHSERVCIGIVLLVYVLVGLIFAEWQLTLIAVLLLYNLHLLYQMSRIVRWLEKGSSSHMMPEVGGLAEGIVRHIYRIRQRSKQRKSRLQSILSRFYSMAVGMPDAVVVLTSAHNIEWANEQAFELLGINHERDQTQRIDNLLRDPAFHVYLQEPADEPLQIQSPLDSRIELNIRIVRFSDGAQLLLARDISSLVRAQAMRKDFVSNVSHEMRTPLTVITGYLETLLNDSVLDPGLREPLNSVSVQANRLRNIVDGLLQLSRLEAGSKDLDTEQVPVASLIRELLREAENSKFGGRHDFQVNADNDLLLIGTLPLVQSILANLIYNALHHTPESTEIQISWLFDAQQERAILAVIDNGPGIPKEHLSRITERFYRVETGRQRQLGDSHGTGLGLSIVKHIVEVLDGHMEVESEVGCGATFRCHFPALRCKMINNGIVKVQQAVVL